MCGKIVHLLPTVDAGVGPTQESTQLKACGTLMVLSSMLSPSVKMGRMLSHAPDSLAVEASRRARALALGGCF